MSLAKKIVLLLAFVVAYLFAVIGSIALVEAVFTGASFLGYAETIAYFTSNAVMVVLFFYYRIETRDRWINDEAQRFLANRSRPGGAHRSKWRRRIRSGMLWTPALFVIIAFLFTPEFVGMASHLSGEPIVGQYRLEIPMTWIIAYGSNTYNGSNLIQSGIWIVAGKGIGRVGPIPYWRKKEPVSEMTFYFAPPDPNDEWLPARQKVLSKQEVLFQNEVLICWDVIPFPDAGPKPMNPAYAEIICPPGKNGFSANFSGWRADLPKFFKILQTASRKQ